MNEYLSKEYVLSCVNNFLSKTDMPIAAQYFYDCFRECKAADVQPVKRGRWIWSNSPEFGNPYGSYICSECESSQAYRENFCPNCGARMIKDGEQNE